MSFDISSFLKALQVKARVLFGLWILGLIIILTPDSFAKLFGILDFRDEYRGLLGSATITSFVFWLVQLFPFIDRWRRKRERLRVLISRLKALTQRERALIIECYRNGAQTIHAPVIDPHVHSLVQKGLLQQAAGMGNNTAWPSTIPDELWHHLQKHPLDLLPEGATIEQLRVVLGLPESSEGD